MEISTCFHVGGVTEGHAVDKCIYLIYLPLSPNPAILHSTKEVNLHQFGVLCFS